MSRDISITISQQNPFDFDIEQNSTVQDLEVGFIQGAVGLIEVYHSDDFEGKGTDDDPLELSEKFYNDLTERIDVEIEEKTKTYVHEQSVAASTWIIVHNLHKHPDITVVDSTGTVVTCKRSYIDENTVKIETNAPFKGKAYLN